LKVQTSAGPVMASVFRNGEVTLLGEILGATCADVTEVTAANSKDSARRDDEQGGRPPYSPNLAPSDFHIFGPLKDALRRRFADDGEMTHGAREDLRRFSKGFHTTGIQRLMQR